MSGPAPKPKATRRRANPPVHEWQATPGVGWQHGAIPEAPDGLVSPSREAWTTWMRAWFASHWTPADLPGLRLVIAQFDAVQRGQAKANDVTTLVRLMDTYGITPAGQQARRWAPPEEPAAPEKVVKPKSQYGNLRVVGQ